MEKHLESIGNHLLIISNIFDDTIDYIQKGLDNFFNYKNDEKKIKLIIIQCENNKLYIEATTDINKTLNKYFNGNSINWPDWLISHPPIKVFQIYATNDGLDEDKLVLYFMNIFGINNVRGGTFNDIIIKDEDFFVIKKMLNRYNCKYKRTDCNIIENNIGHQRDHQYNINNMSDKDKDKDNENVFEIISDNEEFNNNLHDCDHRNENKCVTENTLLLSKSLKDSIIFDYYN